VILLFFVMLTSLCAYETAPVIIRDKKENAAQNENLDPREWINADPLQSINLHTDGFVPGGVGSSLYVDGMPSEQSTIHIDGLAIEDGTNPLGNVDLQELNQNAFDVITLSENETEPNAGGLLTLKSEAPRQNVFESHTLTGTDKRAEQRFKLGRHHGTQRLLLQGGGRFVRSPSTTPRAYGTIPQLGAPEDQTKLNGFARYDVRTPGDVHVYTTHRALSTHQDYVDIYFKENPCFHSRRNVFIHTAGIARVVHRGSYSHKPELYIGFNRMTRTHKQTREPFTSANAFESQTQHIALSHTLLKGDLYTARLGGTYAVDRAQVRQYIPTGPTVKSGRERKTLSLNQKWSPSRFGDVSLKGSKKYTTHSQTPFDHQIKLTFKPRPQVFHITLTTQKTHTLPSLYQQRDLRYGNPHLTPQAAHKHSLGLTFRPTPTLTLTTRAYRTFLRNLIDFQNDRYINVGKAVSQGIHTTACYRLGGWQAFIKHSYTQGKDSHNLQRIRLPLHNVSEGVKIHINEDVEWTIEAMHWGKRADMRREGGGRHYKGTLTLIHTMIRYKLTPQWHAFTRVENLLNKHYENPTGYRQPGLLCVVGLTYRV
jgi:outer membrane cobalamin receptor